MNNKKTFSVTDLSDYKIIKDEFGILLKLSEEVYSVRKRKSWTQDKLAKKANTTQTVISNIENADVNVGIATLCRVAKSLDIDLKFGSTYLVKSSVSEELQDGIFEFEGDYTSKVYKSNYKIEATEVGSELTNLAFP